MDYFKKCPKCGRYMTPYMHYKYGNSYTVWFCDCGYFEDFSGTGTYTTQTTYTGGGASDHTGNNSGNYKSKQS